MMRSKQEMLAAVRELGRILGLFSEEYIPPAFEKLPPDRQRTIHDGLLDSGKCGIRYVVEFSPKRKLRIYCETIEEGGSAPLFDVVDLAHDMGSAKLFIVPKTE